MDRPLKARLQPLPANLSDLCWRTQVEKFTGKRLTAPAIPVAQSNHLDMSSTLKNVNLFQQINEATCMTCCWDSAKQEMSKARIHLPGRLITASD